MSAARQAYPHAPLPWIDLSTGINPFGWPDADKVVIDWRALPDEAGLERLEETAAAFFGAGPGFVAALPGSEQGLRMLAHLGLGDGVHVGPGYASHTAAFDIAIELSALPQAVERGKTILLANPNNPDGRMIEPARLLAMAERLATTGGWLIVDEAFADIDPTLSVAPHVREGLPLLVLRSFGKFFGLAGLRLGFAVGPEAIMERVRHKSGSWPVSSAAQAIGAAAYGDAAWIAQTRARLPREAARLDALLLHYGLTPVGGSPLFRLIDTPMAPALFKRLARAGILTRPFANNERWLRIGLPESDAAYARLAEVLADG